MEIKEKYLQKQHPFLSLCPYTTAFTNQITHAAKSTSITKTQEKREEGKKKLIIGKKKKKEGYFFFFKLLFPDIQKGLEYVYFT